MLFPFRKYKIKRSPAFRSGVLYRPEVLVRIIGLPVTFSFAAWSTPVPTAHFFLARLSKHSGCHGRRGNLAGGRFYWRPD
jgi:hypothetical protein